jgi:hypothetical protein
MTDLKGTIKAVSRFGGVMLEDHDGWLNSVDKKLGEKVYAAASELKGKLVLLRTDGAGKYSHLELVSDEPSTTDYDDLARPVSGARPPTNGQRVGMAVNCANAYVIARSGDQLDPVSYGDEVATYASALLEALAKRGLN